MVDDRGRGGRRPTRSVDELELAIRPEQEPDPDVAAGLAPVLVVDRVDLPELVRRPTRRGDRRDEQVPRRGSVGHGRVRRTVRVLDLLDRDEIRRAEVVHDVVGMRRERRVARVEVLDVVGGDRDLPIRRSRGHLLRQRPRDPGERRGHVQLEVAEAVVDHAHGRCRESVADVDARHRQERVVEMQALGVEVVCADDDAPVVRANPGVRTRVADDRDLTEAARRADRDRGVHLHAHRLERLVEVDPVGRLIERRRTSRRCQSRRRRSPHWAARAHRFRRPWRPEARWPRSAP